MCTGKQLVIKLTVEERGRRGKVGDETDAAMGLRGLTSKLEGNVGGKTGAAMNRLESSLFNELSPSRNLLIPIPHCVGHMLSLRC